MRAQTLNPFPKIREGDTYVYRQYLITGEYTDMETEGKRWAQEAYEDFFFPGELKGEDITLHSTNTEVFGATVGDGSCEAGESRCTGKSAPGPNLVAMFAIECGDSVYLGPDQYNFSPSRASETATIRAYACEGEAIYVRPAWKLLGYFEQGSCEFLIGASYNATFCDPLKSTYRDFNHRKES